VMPWEAPRRLAAPHGARDARPPDADAMQHTRVPAAGATRIGPVRG
jgi:hypothetical protein